MLYLLILLHLKVNVFFIIRTHLFFRFLLTLCEVSVQDFCIALLQFYKNFSAKTSKRSTLHRGSSAHLKITGGSITLTDEEKHVLLITSKINNIDYVPFMDVDLKERLVSVLLLLTKKFS